MVRRAREGRWAEVRPAGRAWVNFDPVRVDLYFDDVRMVSAGVGCGAEAEAAANLLTSPELDPYGKIPEFKFCAVKVEPLREPG